MTSPLTKFQGYSKEVGPDYLVQVKSGAKYVKLNVEKAKSALSDYFEDHFLYKGSTVSLNLRIKSYSRLGRYVSDLSFILLFCFIIVILTPDLTV